MITTDQIPPGWRPDMPMEEVLASLLEHIRGDNHKGFVLHVLRALGDDAVDVLVDATCNIWEPAQHRVKFLGLIRHINGSLTKNQMRRLDADPACKDPLVRSILDELLAENGYSRIDKILDDLGMNLYQHLKSSKR